MREMMEQQVRTTHRKLAQAMAARLYGTRKRYRGYLFPVVLSLLALEIFTCGGFADWGVTLSGKQGAAQSKPGGKALPELPNHSSGPTRQVFIKVSAIYWGDASDLAKPEVFYRQRIRLTSPKRPWKVTGEEALRGIRDDLRQALRKFEKQRNVNIVWDAHGKNCPDATASFIEFLDNWYRQQNCPPALPVSFRKG